MVAVRHHALAIGATYQYGFGWENSVRNFSPEDKIIGVVLPVPVTIDSTCGPNRWDQRHEVERKCPCADGTKHGHWVKDDLANGRKHVNRDPIVASNSIRIMLAL